MRKKDEANAIKRRKEIIDAAKQCFSDKGLAHTTMRDIAAGAELSLGNIYRYFESKEALIAAFIESDNNEWNEAFDWLDDGKNFNKNLKEITKSYVDEIAVKSEMMLFLDILSEGLRNQKVLDLIQRDQGEKRLCLSLVKAVEDNRIKLELAPEATALAIMSYAESVAIKSLVENKYSMRNAIKQLNNLIDILIVE